MLNKDKKPSSFALISNKFLGSSLITLHLSGPEHLSVAHVSGIP